MRKREATSPPRSGYPFSRLSRHEGGAHMPDDRCRLGSDDVIIGLDLASAEHQAVVLSVAGQRLTRFRIPHTRAGLADLLRRTTPAALGRAGGARVFACEATGHLWEAVAYVLRGRGERYVVVNPLATFRVREARQLSREKTDLTDAEQIAELCRTGLVTRTQLETRPYLALRRAWGEYVRLREERARLKVLVAHQLYGLFPEFLHVWADLLQPGALAVLRTGLTPAAMAALSLTEFVAQVRAHCAGHRLWRFKLAQVHREATQTMACPDGLEVLAREVQRDPRQGQEPLNRRRQLEGGPNPLFERVHLPAQFLDLPEQLLAGVRRVWREELEALPQERAAPHAEAIAHLQVVESVLGQRGVNPVLELRALPDKHHPGARQVTLVPQLPGRNPDRRERATPLQPVESPHVELIRLVDLPHHQLRLARVH